MERTFGVPRLLDVTRPKPEPAFTKVKEDNNDNNDTDDKCNNIYLNNVMQEKVMLT